MLQQWRVVEIVRILVDALESVDALPNDKRLVGEFDPATMGTAKAYLDVAELWADVVPAATPGLQPVHRLRTWSLIAKVFGSPWNSPESQQVDWKSVADTAAQLLNLSIDAHASEVRLPTTNTLHLAPGARTLRLVQAGDPAGDRSTAWRELGQALAAFRVLEDRAGRTVSDLAIYDWIIQPALSIDTVAETSFPDNAVSENTVGA